MGRPPSADEAAAVLAARAQGVGIDEVFKNLVMAGKTVKGCLRGSDHVKRYIPHLVRLYQRGTLLRTN
jgi:Zn-dependent alcohol dehydrogenase